MAEDVSLINNANKISSHAVSAVQKGLRQVSTNLNQDSGLVKGIKSVTQVINLVSDTYDFLEPIIRASTLTQVYTNHLEKALDQVLTEKDTNRVACPEASANLNTLVTEIKQNISD